MENIRYGEHFSVLNKEVVFYLTGNTIDPSEEYLFIDFTLGATGHTKSILKSISNSKVLAVDQDLDAIKNARITLANEGLLERCEIVHCNFEQVDKWSERLIGKKANGAILDLGVSSHHFDSSSRGFSFREEGPLDMRMDQSANIPTAQDLVNEMDEKDLADLIFKYGEEKFSRKIASAIVEKRKVKQFKTTKELEDTIFHCYPPKFRHGRTHPATRTFQALRIAVNRELEVLDLVIRKIPEYLKSGSRLAIISFHSLEDRIVKHLFKDLAELGIVKILTKKPILASDEELENNSRSRSAKLRIVEII